MIPMGLDPNWFEGSVERILILLGAGSLIPLKQYDVFP
jgi:hypothetical protein